MGDEPKILFVDDEDSIRLTLPPLLQSYGFEVTAAATVAEALGLISQHKFDVLISDLNIGHPGDGFTVVSAMRSHQPKVHQQNLSLIHHLPQIKCSSVDPQCASGVDSPGTRQFYSGLARWLRRE